MSRIVTIDAPIGGLGDSLLFSTLPQMYREHNATSVHLTKRTLGNCRNPEVRELLYGHNPYLSSIPVDPREADIIAGIPHERAFFQEARLFQNPIACIESLHGFVSQNDRPRLYYTPQRQVIPWHQFVVIDPYSISQHFPDEVIEAFVQRILAFSAYSTDEYHDVIILESKYHHGRNSLLPNVQRYRAKNLYEYIDIVAAARMFLCTESGSQSIAAAVREDQTYALCTTMHMNSRLYVWPNVIYNVTGKLSEDYLWNDATAQDVGAWSLHS